ncbi:MAG TPA: 30S ribosome-binding factor RbfA [Candidatus Omnitrophica bacterium]|nr:30S ribosome-binding factor RbfA [Candidatus Omnitrophota bacterium]
MSRADKVAEEIKREVGMIVQQEVRDPRLGFTTITHVELTPDLRFARIFFSVYGDQKQWEDTQSALEHAAGFIRRILGERLGLRYVPEILFKIDHSSEYSIAIEQRLEDINKDKEAVVRPGKRKNATKKTTRRVKKKK